MIFLFYWTAGPNLVIVIPEILWYNIDRYDTGVCLKIHSPNLHAPFCVIFAPNSGYIAHYAPFIWRKSPTNCVAHLGESIFQTRSSAERSECASGGTKFRRYRVRGTWYHKNVKKRIIEKRETVVSCTAALGFEEKQYVLHSLI